jgi:hypothetical protein
MEEPMIPGVTCGCRPGSIPGTVGPYCFRHIARYYALAPPFKCGCGAEVAMRDVDRHIDLHMIRAEAGERAARRMRDEAAARPKGRRRFRRKDQDQPDEDWTPAQ